MHEGIPILNCHVPKAFVHENGQAHRHDLREGAGRVATRRAGASWCPPASPTSFECDEVLVAVGQENAFPWIERDSRHRLRRVGHAGARQDHPPVDAAARVLRRRRGLRAEEHHLGGGARPRGRDLDRPAAARRGRLASGPPPDRQPDVAEDGHPRVELRQRDLATTSASRCRAAAEKALASIRVEVELGFDAATAFKEAQRCLNCDVQTVFNRQACIECDACVDICPMDCITFTANGEEPDLRQR